MTIPPSFSDIGKKAKDLLGKGYPAHEVKFELKTRTPHTEFTSTVTQKEKDKCPHTGELKAEYKEGDIKVTTTYPTHTDPKVAVEYNAQSLVAGLQLDAEFQTSSEASKRNLQVGLGYKRDGLNFSTKVSPQKTKFQTSAVLGYQNGLVGVDLCGNADGGVNCYDVAFAYTEKSYQLAFFAKDKLSEFVGSLYYKKNDKTEVASKLTFKQGGTPLLEFGAKDILDQDSSLSAKVDSNMTVGVGYSQKLRPSITAILGANYCHHKNELNVGLNLNFEA